MRQIRILLPLAILSPTQGQWVPTWAPNASQWVPTATSSATNASTTNIAPSTLSGQGFFDADIDGIKNDFDFAINDVALALYDCETNTTVSSTTTNSTGGYTFTIPSPGSYRVQIDSMPSWYTLSTAWNGAVANGNKSYPNATNSFDPATESTDCFEMSEGMSSENVDFGVGVQSVTTPANPTTSAPSTTSPGTAGGGGTNATSGPTARPTAGETVSFNDTGTTDVTTPGVTPGGAAIPSPAPTFDDSGTTNAPITTLVTYPPVSAPAVSSPNATVTAPTLSPAGANGTIPTIPPASSLPSAGENNATSMTPSLVSSESPSDIPSPLPSIVPSLTISEIPSLTVSEIPSQSPSNATITLAPARTPSDSSGTTSPSIPTQIGDPIGPITTENLKMTLDGISALENDTAWGEYTATYIQNYFSTGFHVWDVTVDISVRGQSPGGGGGSSERRLRAPEGTSVEVTYDQTTTYKTDDGSDVDVVITEPFASSLDQMRYIIYLGDQSSYYEDVTAASVAVPGDESGGDISNSVEKAPETTTPPTKSNTPVIIGVVATLGMALIVGGLYYMYVQRDRGDEYSEEEEEHGVNGNGNYVPSVRSGRSNDHLETGSKSSAHSRNRSQGSHQNSRTGNYQDDVSAITAASYQEPAGEILEVIAPAGKLGVVVDIPPDRRGPPFVCDIREESPLYGQLEPGDKIYAVDDEDVRKMSAIKVSKLLAQKSENPERIITVFREYREE